MGHGLKPMASSLGRRECRPKDSRFVLQEGVFDRISMVFRASFFLLIGIHDHVVIHLRVMSLQLHAANLQLLDLLPLSPLDLSSSHQSFSVSS